MIPENATRGRKRRHGKAANTAGDSEALKLLNSFRAKLDQVPPESNHLIKAHAPEHQPMTNGINATDDDDEALICDLHFIANCQSCQSWDKTISGDVDAKEDNDLGWMSHALNFERDRLGKDLNWKKRNEEDLVVIDPREKAKEIKHEQKMKRSAKSGLSSRAWDRDRDVGRLPERMAGERS
jgi:peptidyl-prolyl cis-trans isomerase SDCCAG10